MDRLHLMTVFVAVAEEAGFAAGARRLGMSPAAVTRAVAALEERLGVRLLERSTRLVRATEAGQRYLDDARRILQQLDEADEAAAGLNAAPRGRLAVTAPVLFGRMYVMPGIVDYLRRYPGTEVNAMFVDRVVNLLEEGQDVAVRIGELADSSLRALPVGRVRRIICAAPSYIAEHGAPAHPSQLDAHTIIASTSASIAPEWRFRHDDAVHAYRVRPRLAVTTMDAAIDAARRGLGLVRLLSYQAAPWLASGELAVVLGGYELPHVPIHIVHRDGRHGSARIHAFIDLLAERLRGDPALA
ncbi:DNA-binding transcriptional LysR family regulator [Pseudoduganella flava]|uniref:DNA-binding transcriptional LysR family regulator n=1 Tax=Pseudoduganella flava TaxID=871742 RepID=A0A562PVL6_9BURK|nr:LysR family transcriptional regulator [Pseudoduganella flava]QGZ39589.1 LysR family transcriptional regulator [Pseudoduganella flava]TWI48485.1 DNA-binding transcriptional LysR family regulator [Pseudoduganella flava]